MAIKDGFYLEITNDKIPHKSWVCWWHDDLVGFKETLVVAFSPIKEEMEDYVKKQIENNKNKMYSYYLGYKN